jgi:DEAD/DEAH box helicase domain-containing protein
MSGEREILESEDLLRERRKRWYLAPSISYPAASVNIRSAGGEDFLVIDTSTSLLLETVDSSIAFFQVHPGAVYLHQGESFIVTGLDLASRTAHVAPTDVAYYTQTKDITDLHVVEQKRIKSAGMANVCLGDVEVTTRILGYKKKAQFTEEVIGEEPLELPSQTFPTVALWFDLPPGVVERIEESGLDLAGGLHAVEHAAIGILPLFALCDRNDIGGVSAPIHPDTGRAQVFIYDAYPGGVGIAEKGYDMVAELWQATMRVIAECPCHEGCPSCIQSPKCGNNNKPLDKEAAKTILEGLVEKEV